MIKNRILGRRNLEVSELGFACQCLEFGFKPVTDKKDITNLVTKAIDMGITFFDMADVNNPYAIEEIVGEILYPFKNKIVMATKFGYDTKNGVNSHPEHIRKTVEGSLGRLKVDVIDLLFQHSVDPKIPMEEVAGTVKTLIEEGKVRHFGLSGASAKTIRMAHSIQEVTALQREYSIWSRLGEKEIMPTIEELGIGLLAYRPLGNSLLTCSNYENDSFANIDIPNLQSIYAEEGFITNMALVVRLKEYAKQKNATPSQIALSWIMAQNPWIVPMLGAAQLRKLGENVETDTVKLNAEEIKQLTIASSSIEL